MRTPKKRSWLKSGRETGISILVTVLATACDAPSIEPPVAWPTSPGTPLGFVGVYSTWSPAVRLETGDAPADPAFNTEFLEGCPMTSRDGKTFYMASNRPNGKGGIDIWVSTRGGDSEPWGLPVNAGEPVNSEYNDFCPTIDRDGHRLFFVSNRPAWGTAPATIASCGGADIYVTRLRDDGTFDDPANPAFDEPENVGCAPAGPNSAADEASPFPFPENGSGPTLYFSSARAGGFSQEGGGAVNGDQDIYMSRSYGGVFGPAELVPGVNSPSDDGQPNVRHDGLEMFFFSNRPGTLGMSDIYSATRGRTSGQWSAPGNLGANVNSTAAESRPSLSWDGSTLYFGSTRTSGTAEGSNDIYVTKRERINNPHN